MNAQQQLWRSNGSTTRANRVQHPGSASVQTPHASKTASKPVTNIANAHSMQGSEDTMGQLAGGGGPRQGVEAQQIASRNERDTSRVGASHGPLTRWNGNGRHLQRHLYTQAYLTTNEFTSMMVFLSGRLMAALLQDACVRRQEHTVKHALAAAAGTTAACMRGYEHFIIMLHSKQQQQQLLPCCGKRAGSGTI